MFMKVKGEDILALAEKEVPGCTPTHVRMNGPHLEIHYLPPKAPKPKSKAKAETPKDE